MNLEEDAKFMAEAIEVAEKARFWSSPNPWVGVVVVAKGQVVGKGFTGPFNATDVAENSTQPEKGFESSVGVHAEIAALAQAGKFANGATLYTTLEPCNHHGRTSPCTDAVIQAGIKRVVVALVDPDKRVSGSGVESLRSAGIEVDVGQNSAGAEKQLTPYLHHRHTGRPYVFLKLAATLDGRIAAPDGSSNWITGEEARIDVHKLRAESDAICVGAGTVRSDDPRLTVRSVDGPSPRRIVIGEIPEGAQVEPAESWKGSLEDLIQKLGNEGVLQLLVEGGAHLAGQMHREGLVDRYVIYVSPSIMGGDDGKPLLSGDGVATMESISRGKFANVTQLGEDVRLDLVLS
ncbi:MAG: bifunctional diaminohydroxyphosphoribosylaminopyrimidine deaminase/5-amino-6-(5-phosphoribosylamino)uracil reductase RibD [Acidimicrobiales bacterium]|nr:bifunctional diaminohydroxyphosphoribosylaminopyrimidine deaminase/5-amino-6-(5-phosphoribosylamino)uracil reductase RibD [Acidimicrobiales bacterium]